MSYFLTRAFVEIKVFCESFFMLFHFNFIRTILVVRTKNVAEFKRVVHMVKQANERYSADMSLKSLYNCTITEV